jgi:putative DNA primase/helicase
MTVDLRTGITREYRREDYITKISGTWIDETMPIPIWNNFLGRVTGDDKDLQLYLQRMAGYCLTGVTTEHVMFFLYGPGANGKGVFLNALKGMWGDYAVTASMDTFIETDNDRHPTELAFLDGARLVIAQETESGKRWAQAKIQALTGGDDITARYMRQDFFTFRPRFKLVIAGNHKPSLNSVDEAIRRRFHLIPFTTIIPPRERDFELGEKLKAEWPGIMWWATKGCLEWQKIGLAPPKAVTDATNRYLEEEDPIARWIADSCVTNKEEFGVGDLLWRDWQNWVRENAEQPKSRKWFADQLDRRGYTPGKSQGVRGYNGINLNASRKPPRYNDC